MLLLAHEPFWQALLNGCAAAPGGNVILLHGANWDVFSARYGSERNTVLLTTPDLLPKTGTCLLPTVVLLEEEPLVGPSGVSDWLVRDTLTGDVLRRCLRYVHERSRLEDTLRRLAGQDPLTGIANRQGFQALLASRLAEGGSLALGHLDLDNFRHANDSLGHQAGDRLILQVVARLKNQARCRRPDRPSGTDEFALLIDTRTAPARALQLAERITDVLAEPY
ncbi:GGDEF domain-containing protein, partial [Pseudomonas syringae pv. actinidiae]|nr:GGDEF domain-containing protein [Pseudomonas syringae pv. actinidiae]